MLKRDRFFGDDTVCFSCTGVCMAVRVHMWFCTATHKHILLWEHKGNREKKILNHINLNKLQILCGSDSCWLDETAKTANNPPNKNQNHNQQIIMHISNDITSNKERKCQTLDNVVRMKNESISSYCFNSVGLRLYVWCNNVFLACRAIKISEIFALYQNELTETERRTTHLNVCGVKASRKIRER